MTNRERALAAEAALDTFTHQTYGGRDAAELNDEDNARWRRQTALSDLLCDLMHYARQQGFDFDAELRLAARHFDHESRYGWYEDVPA